MRTAIPNGTVIGWVNESHQVIDDATVVFEDDKIIHVGPDYAGQVDETIDATGRIVMPGLVNAHLHVTDTLYTKGYLEEAGSAASQGGPTNFFALYKVLPSVRGATDSDAQVAAAECAFAELASNGATTVVEMGYDFEIGGGADIAITERVADVAGRSGLRAYSAPRYRSRYYGDDDKGGVFYRDYGNKAAKRFEDCLAFCSSWNGRYDDRLRTMLAPGQIDTCEAQLLRDTRRYGDALKIPIQIHAGQSPNEYARVKETDGKTTIELMMETGLLGPDFIIGHGQIMTGDGDALSMSRHEADALRESRTTICHLPWVKARRGGVINSIHKYREMGFRQCLGTDTYPFDLFNDMRFASVICKILEKSAEAAPARDIFHMATVGGADALGRADIGRLAPGCKADIALLRTDTPKAAPVYDPFLFLVLAATGDDVDRVIVDGKTIVDQGEVLTIDVPQAVREVNAAGERVRARLEL